MNLSKKAKHWGSFLSQCRNGQKWDNWPGEPKNEVKETILHLQFFMSVEQQCGIMTNIVAKITHSSNSIATLFQRVARA